MHVGTTLSIEFFGYHRWESVKAMIYGLGRLNVTCEIIVRKLKFSKRLYFKSGFLHDMFWAALLSDMSDDCLRSVLYTSLFTKQVAQNNKHTNTVI